MVCEIALNYDPASITAALPARGVDSSIGLGFVIATQTGASIWVRGNVQAMVRNADGSNAFIAGPPGQFTHGTAPPGAWVILALPSGRSPSASDSELFQGGYRVGAESLAVQILGGPTPSPATSTESEPSEGDSSDNFSSPSTYGHSSTPQTPGKSLGDMPTPVALDERHLFEETVYRTPLPDSDPDTAAVPVAPNSTGDAPPTLLPGFPTIDVAPRSSDPDPVSAANSPSSHQTPTPLPVVDLDGGGLISAVPGMTPAAPQPPTVAFSPPVTQPPPSPTPGSPALAVTPDAASTHLPGPPRTANPPTTAETFAFDPPVHPQVDPQAGPSPAQPADLTPTPTPSPNTNGEADGEDGDLDGATVSLAAHREALASDAEPRVQAVLCPSGHANPLHGDRCRTCDALIHDRTVQLVARPSLGRIRFDNGTEVELNRHLVIGRKPAPDPTVADGPFELVKVTDNNEVVSRTHLVVRIEGWYVYVIDRDSTNNTFVESPGRPPFQLRPGEPFPILPGTVVSMGEEISFSYDATQR